MHTRDRIFYLLNKYISNTIEPEERDELFSTISSGKNDPFLEEYFNANLDKASLIQADLTPQKSQEILHEILNAEKQTFRIIPAAFRRKLINRWAIAALIMGLIIFSALLAIETNKPDIAETVLTKQPATNLLERRNLTEHSIKLELEDSSIVILEPGASLKYPPHFSTAKREVYMDGEIFFEITKNPERPFFVYNDNLITRVLGTSFNIKVDKVKKQVEVAVVTGRVQVYENEQATNKHGGGVILTPNQRVVFNNTDRNFATTLVTNPRSILIDDPSLKAVSFVFDEASLSTVLNTIEKTYGIKMVVESPSIYNSLFTGNITKYNLYTKLDIICESTKTSYEVIGTKILIKSKH